MRSDRRYSQCMLKEIHEQPEAVRRTLDGWVKNAHLLDGAFGPSARCVFERTEHVHIVGSGTSYHAGAVGRYLIEQICRLPCSVEVSSEYSYRKPAMPKRSLLVALGETADTLAAARLAKRDGSFTLAICNASESSLVRESDLMMHTRAGAELAVSATKTFTTQLVALGLLVVALVRHRNNSPQQEGLLLEQLLALPAAIDAVLALEPEICALARRLASERHALFLGRGVMYPIAMEGALKMKEVAYIQAEAYAAGELKHGPLALVDATMPVIAMVPCDAVLEKLKSNLMEVRARKGHIIVLTDPGSGLVSDEGIASIAMPAGLTQLQCSVVYSVALQLLAFHVALLKGVDPGRPRGIVRVPSSRSAQTSLQTILS